MNHNINYKYIYIYKKTINNGKNIIKHKNNYIKNAKFFILIKCPKKSPMPKFY